MVRFWSKITASVDGLLYPEISRGRLPLVKDDHHRESEVLLAAIMLVTPRWLGCLAVSSGMAENR